VAEIKAVLKLRGQPTREKENLYNASTTAAAKRKRKSDQDHTPKRARTIDNQPEPTTLDEVRSVKDKIQQIFDKSPCNTLALQTNQEAIQNALNYHIALLQEEAKVQTRVRKPVRTQFRGFNADELHDLTSQMNSVPSSKWTEEMIQTAVHRLIEVSTLFMRGSAEACQALDKFHRDWIAFLTARPDVRELMDPEIIIMDIPFAVPATWATDQNRANLNLGAPVIIGPGGPGAPPAPAVIGIAVPAPAPPAGGLPAGAPAPPAGGVSETVFTATTVASACSFGSFLHGRHYGLIRGYWLINTAGFPVYY